MAATAELSEEERNAEDSPVSDEDDEAPESVSFNQGREEALQSKSKALQELQRANLKAKEKRRERDRLLKEQKQRKKVSLSNARLPEVLLTKLTEQQEITSQERKEEVTEEVHEDKDDLSDDEDGDMDNSEEEEEEKEPTIEVIQRSKMVHHEPHKAALQFLQTQLYGSRIPRESTASHMSRKMKRLGKPAMIFCNKQPQGGKKKRHKKRRVASDDTL